MLQNYLKILLFLGVCFGWGLLLTGLAFLRSTSRPDPEKTSPYECGFNPLSPLRFPMDVRFVLVALLFIIFDLEVIFLFPWAVRLRELGMQGFLSVVCFLTIVTLGFVYEWAKGALEWD